MSSLLKLLLAVLLLVLVAFVEETRGDAIVSGTVICDQCKDGHTSLFDYPLSGMKVAVTCGDGTGQVTTQKEETTNILGSYTVRFSGSPDLSHCYAQLVGNGQGSTGCGAVAGPAQQLRLVFTMFDTEMYIVDSLISQPAQPMSFCPRSSTPVIPQPKPITSPPISPVIRPPPTSTPPPIVVPPVIRPPPTSTPPPIVVPPVIRPPPTSTPPPIVVPPPTSTPPAIPFLGASACPYKNWTMPENRCHWSFVGPDTKVAVAFGLVAARRYGTDMTLWQGLQGRGETYKTLLREATTALLNSYNSIQYRYPTLDVITRTNFALMGSQRHALMTALRFLRANSGSGNVHCNLTPCKGDN